MTVYVVTGDGPRCGSSMMMRALEAGGLENVYDPECNPIPAKHSKLTVEDCDIRELPITAMKVDGFPDPALYDGKVLKIFPEPTMPLSAIVMGDYRVLWLQRPAAARYFSGLIYQGQRVHLYPENFVKRDGIARNSLCNMRERPDIDLIEAAYDKIITTPRPFFDALAERGWPIDAAQAATIPDPKRRRFNPLCR